MQLDQDRLMQFAAGIVGIAALVWLIQDGAITGGVAVPVITAILAALGAYETGRRGEKRRGGGSS